MSRGFTSAVIILGVVFFITVATVTFYLGNFSVPQPQKTEVAKITPKSSPTPIPTDETANPDSIGANWKTYINTAFNYQIKYPNGYTISDQAEQTKKQTLSDSKICFIKEDHCSVTIASYRNTSNLSLEEWVNKNEVPLQSYGGIIKATTKKNLNGYEAFYASNETEAAYYLKHDSYIYRVDSSINQDDVSILSTFKFLPDGAEGKFCGGITGKLCPEGLTCKIGGNYPDAGGKCIKSQ